MSQKSRPTFRKVPSKLERLVFLAFGKDFIVSNWLLAIGATVSCYYIVNSLPFFRAFGISFQDLFPVLLDFLRYKPVISLFFFMGLLGRKLVGAVQKRNNSRAPNTAPFAFDNRGCHQVAHVLGGSYRLPIWLLLPSLVWFTDLLRTIRDAYERDFPVGLQMYIGPRPHIDDFWQDVFWPSAKLSVSSTGFWLFLLCLAAGTMIAACRARRQKSE